MYFGQRKRRRKPSGQRAIHSRRLALESLECRNLLTASATPTFETVHEFTGVPLSGADPRAGLTLVGSVVYGTTDGGGPGGYGTVFSMNPDGSNYQIVHSFTGSGNDASFPAAELTQVGSVLYGTTDSGGTSSSGGTIFSMNLDGSNFQVLYSFPYNLGSVYPGQLSYSASAGSVLYGTTFEGGASSNGTIFSIKLDGSNFQVLHSFTGDAADTKYPQGQLAIIGSTLYGTTSGDSGDLATDSGVVYSIHTDGSSYNVIHRFSTSSNEGRFPESGLTAVGSTLYGATNGGGTSKAGTIFSMSADGSKFQYLHFFTSTDSWSPKNDLTVVGSTLYGTTTYGPGGFAGGIFSINTDGTNFQVLDTLPSQSAPTALALAGTVLLGASNYTGPDNDGTLFSINLNGANLQTIHEYPYESHEGRAPESGLIQVGYVLYGTTKLGGTANDGTVYSMNLDGSNLQVLHSFEGGTADGMNPVTSVVSVGSVLYGTTQYGGTNNDGTLFSINADGSNYQVLHNFTGSISDGANPLAELTPAGSVLFGTTELGGVGNSGTIFSVNIDGSNFDILRSGDVPVAALTLVGSTLYGTTGRGGSAGYGSVFSMNMDGSNFQVLHSFTSQPAIVPGSKLTLVGSTLYGETGGGIESYFQVFATPGALFSLNLDGSNFQILHTFSRGTTDGILPLGGLTAVGTKLFGTAYTLGGTGAWGIVYSMDSDGSNYQIVHVFKGQSDGGLLYSGLLQVGSTLYGTASLGPQGYGGTIYSLTLPVPQVTSVQISSSDWSNSYLSALQAAGLGDGTGYSIPIGSPSQTLPWGNVDQIQITFNEDVTVEQASLALTGINVLQYVFSGFSYDPTTFTATWTLATPIAVDKLNLNLASSGANGVVDNLGLPLDGQWTGDSSYPAGNGLVGTDFNIAFNMLPGDANQDGVVNGLDVSQVASHWLQSGDVAGDTNGDDVVNGLDIAAVASHWLSTLPTDSQANVLLDSLPVNEIENDASSTSAVAASSVPVPLSIGSTLSSVQAVDHVATFVSAPNPATISPAVDVLPPRHDAGDIAATGSSPAARLSNNSLASSPLLAGMADTVTAAMPRTSHIEGDLLETLSLARAIRRTAS